MEPAIRWLIIATLACVVGCATLIAIGGPQLVTAAGIVLGGLAFVLVLSGGFYAVGRSEERERERSRGGSEDPPA